MVLSPKWCFAKFYYILLFKLKWEDFLGIFEGQVSTEEDWRHNSRAILRTPSAPCDPYRSRLTVQWRSETRTPPPHRTVPTLVQRLPWCVQKFFEFSYILTKIFNFQKLRNFWTKIFEFTSVFRPQRASRAGRTFVRTGIGAHVP